jgi:hypothetical protein
VPPRRRPRPGRRGLITNSRSEASITATATNTGRECRPGIRLTAPYWVSDEALLSRLTSVATLFPDAIIWVGRKESQEDRSELLDRIDALVFIASPIRERIYADCGNPYCLKDHESWVTKRHEFEIDDLTREDIRRADSCGMPVYWLNESNRLTTDFDLARQPIEYTRSGNPLAFRYRVAPASSRPSARRCR